MGVSDSLSPPTLLTDDHVLDRFSSGEASLDNWLKKRALRNVKLGATRVYVLCPAGSPEVIGYYGLSAAEIDHSDLVGSMRRNMPDPVPAILLGRLAIDQRHQGGGLGYDLLKHALGRSALAADIIGARVMMVHALNDTAQQFYERAGYVPLPGTVRSLGIDLRKVISDGNN